MKRCILFGSMLFIFLGILSAQTVKGPSIHFEKTAVDFKQVSQDSLLHYTFEFKNTGTDTLAILNVRPG